MKVKHALAATTAAVFLTTSGFALAQQATPRATEPAPSERMAPGAGLSTDQNASLARGGALHEIKDNDARVSALNVSVKDLSGMDIYGSDGKKIGDVDKVLADSSNSVKAVTLDVGGFLGMGAREVVLPIDKLQKGTEKDRLQVSLTKAEIEKLDKWEDTSRNNPRREPSAAETPRTAPPAQPTR